MNNVRILHLSQKGNGLELLRVLKPKETLFYLMNCRDDGDGARRNMLK
jgi:hypothetical protein